MKVMASTCDCTEGYSGKNCEIVATICDNQPCKHNSTCKPLNNDTYLCDCRKGYSGKNCEIVETVCDNQPCKHNSTCKPLDKDTYICDCREGYSGKIVRSLKQYVTINFASIIPHVNPWTKTLILVTAVKASLAKIANTSYQSRM